MTREEARTALSALAKATTPPVLSTEELDACLTLSRLPDNEGRPPSDPAFVEENWDLNYAAAEAWMLKYASSLAVGSVKKFSSEGSSFEKTSPNYLALAEWYRERSSVGGDGGGIVVIELENEPPSWMLPRSAERC